MPRRALGDLPVPPSAGCVGGAPAIETAVEIARPGGAIGRVGVPPYESGPQAQPLFYKNVKVGGGPAPVRAYIDELLPDILDGAIDPGRVFDRTVDLVRVPDGYRAMADREPIKVMVTPWPAALGRHENRKETDMQITRNSPDTNQGPSDWFTGTVFIDTIANPTAPSRVAAAAVHFAPGARTAWHTHPLGQTIYVTEGIGRCQREGGPIEEIKPGDRVYFEPGENHWHGAAPGRLMTHIAIQEADDSGSPVVWGRHVTDDEYAASSAG